MFLKNYQNVFLFFLVAGTIVATSASSWITSWVGLEINLMSLIPLILTEPSFKSTEASIKYFLSQALASVLLIATAVIMTLTEQIFMLMNFSAIIFSSLAIKAGLAPFHFWFPQVMKSISWSKNILILVWQKLAPFILMACFSVKTMLFFLMVTCAMTGALGGLNMTDSKLILTYSSIAHSAWMIMMTSISSSHWFFYFTIYSSLVIPIILEFKNLNIFKLTELNKTKTSLTEKICISFMIMSLGGLPPFAGFAAKLYAMAMIMKYSSLSTLVILILSSLISLFYYTKLFYNLLTKSSYEKKISLSFLFSKSKKSFTGPILFILLISLLVLLT